jgi:uracil phosphoribosyltransferase
MAGRVTVVDHPLVQHKLTLLRRTETSAAEFRAVLREMSMLLTYEVTRDLPLTSLQITTPLVSMHAPVLAGKPPVVVAILRAGQGMLDGLLTLLPMAAVGYIGLARDPQTHAAGEYYVKVPADIAERSVLVVDPMLATGNSAVAALQRLTALGATALTFVCILAVPEGIAQVHRQYPDVPIYTAAIDECLNAHAYIVPGLGDAGDRLFGTV